MSHLQEIVMNVSDNSYYNYENIVILPILLFFNIHSPKYLLSLVK